jgi:hypothetical protein
MQIPKNDNHSMQMQILLIIVSASIFSPLVKSTNLAFDLEYCERRERKESPIIKVKKFWDCVW